MKTIKHTIRVILIIALTLGFGVSAMGQLPTSGDWNETTITEDLTINLAGDINLMGCITVSNGATLVINNNTGSNKNIFNKYDTSLELEHLFLVNPNSTLKINGGSKGITIGGGANYLISNVQLDEDGFIKDTLSLGVPVRSLSNAAIDNNGGTLILTKTTIQNVSISCTGSNDDNSSRSGTIRHRGNATTTIKDCSIQLCKGWTGAGIFIRSNANGTVNIENTTFQYCVNSITVHMTHGGTVRAWGTAATHLNLKNVKVHHCYSQVDAAALYWPANGKNNDGKYATLTFDGCEFYKNKAATQNGGALDLCGTVQFVNNVTKVHNNVAKQYGGGMSIRPYNSGSPATEALNVIYDVTDKLNVYDNTAHRGGGIAFHSGMEGSTLPAGTSFEINLNGAHIHGNHAVGEESGNGGGIWLRNDYVGTDFSFTFNMNKGTVYENTAKQDGGGIYLYGWKIVSSDKPGDVVSIHDNEASSNGGGIFINVGSDYIMNNGQITNNSASVDGAGVYMRDGNFTMNNGELSSNDSGRNGGGLLMQKGSILLKNGTIFENTAVKYGGGLAKTDAGNITIEGGSISNNTAGIDGGGVYNKGDGNTLINSGVISNNSANMNGGGVFNGNGNLTVNGGTISLNKAANNGGAFYSSSGELRVDGGEVTKNEASLHGGGVFVLGGNVLFENGKLTNNSAINGGGVFLASGTSMTFTDGLIAKNKATALEGETISTAFSAKSAVPNVNGCGGGIYLRSGSSTKPTSLAITVKNGFGLYGNTADRAGDDIVAEGVYTSVTVPNVTAMDLKDFEGKDAQPNWYEDYVYVEGGSDSGYSDHSILKYPGGSGKRFQQMLGSTDIDKHLVLFEESQRQYNDYVCLSLGYIVLTAKIQVTGLHEKENMYFVVVQYAKNTSGAYEFVKQYPVLVKGMGNATEERIVRNLMPGYYTVKQMKTGATPWAWAYTVQEPVGGVYDKRQLFEDGVNNVFPFTVNHVENERNVMHDEELKVNKMVGKN